MHPHIPYTVDGHWSPASSGDTCDASSCLPPCSSLTDHTPPALKSGFPGSSARHARMRRRIRATTQDRNAPALQPLHIRMASVARAADSPRRWRVATRHGFVVAGAGVRVWVRLRVHGRGNGGEVPRKHHAMPHSAPQPASACGGCSCHRAARTGARLLSPVHRCIGCRGASTAGLRLPWR